MWCGARSIKNGDWSMYSTVVQANLLVLNQYCNLLYGRKSTTFPKLCKKLLEYKLNTRKFKELGNY